jgi:hypothetical protein
VPRIPHVFLTLRKGADSDILVLIEAKAEPKLQWLPVAESSPSTSLVVRGLLAKQAVPRMLADDSGRMTGKQEAMNLAQRI